jgi:hypothetical protein
LRKIESRRLRLRYLKNRGERGRLADDSHMINVRQYNNMHTERRKDALIGSGIHQFIGLARDHVDAGAGFLEYALPIRWGP